MRTIDITATITGFDGHAIRIAHSADHQTGWEVYLDGDRVEPRERHCGTQETLLELGRTIDPAETPDLRVRHAGTERLIEVHPDLRGFINNADQSRLPLNVTAHNPMALGPILQNLSGFPVSEAMINHVSGNTDRRSYFLVGYACAADMLSFGVLNSPSNKVFDIGCGCGRVGQFVASMLDPELGGSYTGYDTWGKGIAWASQNITPLMPHARFVALGNADAYDASTSFSLDLPSASQDSFIATSVFTHLRRPAAEGYYAEIGRILKPGGRAYITYFASKTLCKATQTRTEDDYAINVLKGETEDTFVDEPQISAMANRHGLVVLGRKYGYWRGEQYRYRHASGFQDVFILKRRAISRA